MKYRVAFYYDIGGTVVIDAEDSESAKAKVKTALETSGISGVVERSEFKIENREYNTLDTEVVE